MLFLLLGLLGFGIRQDSQISNLLYAFIDNRTEDVVRALNEGAQLNEVDEDGFTCVEIAKRMGYTQMLHLVLATTPSLSKHVLG